MKVNTCLLLAAILFSALASCKKNNNSDTPRTADVYVAGFTTVNNNTVATYWKNGAATTLAGTKSKSALNSVLAQNADVYFAGYYTATNGKQVAALWKNNKITKLTGSTGDSQANGLFISGEDVYVAGVLNGIAAYWKNGTAVILSDYSLQSVANAVYVDGEKIVVVGNVTNTFGLYFAAFWQDGGLTALPPTDVVSSNANALLYINGKVNIVGSSYQTYVYDAINVPSATLWDATGTTTLGNKVTFSDASDIIANGNDVFISGVTTAANGISVATYWKNGIKNTLSDSTANSDALGISSAAGDIYLTGYDSGGRAVYWKNGAVVKLSNTVSSGRSIAVVKL